MSSAMVRITGAACTKQGLLTKMDLQTWNADDFWAILGIKIADL